MKKNLGLFSPIVFVAMTVAFTSCKHTTLADRAAKDAQDFTERYCPTPVQDMQRLDSVTFDRATLTLCYHYRLSGNADNMDAIKLARGKIKKALLEDLKNDTQVKAYKDAGYNFRYIFYSEKSNSVLMDEKFSKNNYK